MKGVFGHEGLLQGVLLIGPADPLDRGHRIAVMGDGQRQTGVDPQPAH